MDTWTEALDLLVRGGAICTLLLGAALLLRRPDGRATARPAVALCLGLCAYLLVSTPTLPEFPGPAMAALIGLASIVPVLVYWAGNALFLDGAPLARWQLALGAATVCTALAVPIVPALGALRAALVLGLFGHLLYNIAAGSAGDLIEPRRRFRRWFLTIGLILGVLITGFEVLELDAELPPPLLVLHGAAFLALAAVFVVWAAHIPADIWGVTTPQTAPPDRPTPADAALVIRVEAAMQAGLWQQEGLTVPELAARLNTREHRLRRAINQVLGHRNFASFVNGYRIDAARAALADPARADETVLAIAYEVGFASLGPFNRAFRAATGQTPTQYRAACQSSGTGAAPSR